MTRLKEFRISTAVVPKGIVGLIEAPLTKFHFEVAMFTQESLNAVTCIIESCVTLVDVFIGFGGDPETHPSDKSSVFRSVLENKSIRKFNFMNGLDDLTSIEYDSFLRLIRETKSIRELTVSLFCIKASQFSSFIDAFAENQSIETTYSESFALIFDDLQLNKDQVHVATKREINKAMVHLFTKNTTLKSLNWDIFEDILPWLDFALYKVPLGKNSVIQDFQITDKKLKDSDYTDEPILTYLNDQAANLLKFGRILCGAKIGADCKLNGDVFGLILAQITANSVWEDQKWKQIRRVVRNRDTIGQLWSDTRPFDAYELLYLCSV